MKGLLYLFPNTLGNPDWSGTIPPALPALLPEIRVYIVENLRNARRYLKSLDRSMDIDSLVFHELNEHTQEEEIPDFLDEVQQGSNAAIISEAGVPGVADPGAKVVRLAHEKGIRVIPLTGPSSILLSLMASGLNGQSFQFHGYLPVKRPERIKRIKELEAAAHREKASQIFIEAPYRNDALMQDMVQACHPATLLCVAADLTMESEMIRTLPVGSWRKKLPSLHKRPVIFLLGS